MLPPALPHQIPARAFLMASRSTENIAAIDLIAAFKLFKGVVLFAVGVGALRLLHRDFATVVYEWANAFRVDPGNHFLQRILERFALLNEQKLKALSVGTFFYSALLLTEGTGLLLHKRWAQYFTIIATGSFIPLELYELIRRATVAKGIVFLLNILIVVYLVIDLRRNHR
jgi:uncharacterized membrane protein (DUF2068 family)